MKLPDTAHTSRPWRIHQIAPDFRLEDVWALPTPGGPDDLPRLVASMVGDGTNSFPEGAPPVVRFLWNARQRIGALLGLDGADSGVGTRVSSLRDRLPTDLREGPRGPDFTDVPLTSCTCCRTSGRRRWPTLRSTRSCPSAGSRTGPAATTARWRS